MSRIRSSDGAQNRAHHRPYSRYRLGSGETWREVFENRPPWMDGVLLRRILAALCVCTAAIVLLRDDPERTRIAVVAAARDLPPGHILTPGDLRFVRLPPATAPDGAARRPDDLTGAVLTAALRSGEVLTDVRIVGPRLAEVASGIPDARIVPVQLADNAVTEVLRAGDRVDIVAANTTDPAQAAILATDAAVVLVSAAPAGPGAGRAERVVLLALDARRAAAVAAASLNSALTVIFH